MMFPLLSCDRSQKDLRCFRGFFAKGVGRNLFLFARQPTILALLFAQIFWTMSLIRLEKSSLALCNCEVYEAHLARLSPPARNLLMSLATALTRPWRVASFTLDRSTFECFAGRATRKLPERVM